MDELSSLPFRVRLLNALAAAAAARAAQLSGADRSPLLQPDGLHSGSGNSSGNSSGGGGGGNSSAPASCSARGRVAVVTTWAGDVWGLRRELLPWMMYHAHAGVEHFYVRCLPA